MRLPEQNQLRPNQVNPDRPDICRTGPFVVHTAALPQAAASQDRVFADGCSVVIADGVTALEPLDGDPATYADRLGRTLLHELARGPAIELRAALATAIADTVSAMGLDANNRPSSTVSVARCRGEHLELLVLGDSPVLIGHRDTHQDVGQTHEVVTDTRLAVLKPRSRTEARQLRNTPGGYWIAEVQPHAAQQALVRRLPLVEVEWVVLATDGAYDPIAYLGPPWAELATRPEQAGAVLAACQRWEAEVDPDRVLLPRGKRHDDKTLAVMTRPAAGSAEEPAPG